MAYLGSTQLSSVANPPVLLTYAFSGMDARIAGSSGVYLSNSWKSNSTATYNEGRAFGGQLWGYWTTDVSTAVTAAGYFTDAGPLGMRPGDVVMIVGCGTTVGSSVMLRFQAVASISTAGAATLASTAMGSIYGVS